MDAERITTDPRRHGVKEGWGRSIKAWLENHPRHEIEEWSREGILGPIIYAILIFVALGLMTMFGLWAVYGL